MDAMTEPAKEAARQSKAVMIARVVVALQEKPHTLQSLGRQMTCTKETTRRVFDDLREAGMIEFKGWGEKPTRGTLPALYGWKKTA
jgi:predicted ArsR family transcriptional regulator